VSSPLIPSRHGEAWNDEDIATLRRMAAQGQPLAEISRVLERTREAVQRKAQALKVRVGL